jgi:hypothetical protein
MSFTSQKFIPEILTYEFLLTGILHKGSHNGSVQTHTHTHNDPEHTLPANGCPAICIFNFYLTNSSTPFICEYYISVELKQNF